MLKPYPIEPTNALYLAGGPSPDVNGMLQSAGLRPTRQRMALGWLLFSKGERHITAEMLYEEARASDISVSLATVYNTLNQFVTAGLLRQVSVDGAKNYFDTNVSSHQHFYVESARELIDIPNNNLASYHLSGVPIGYEISRVDMIIRLRRAS
jgi:Fur family iron response transcriptional regulator